MRYKRIRYLDRFILYDFIRNLIILYFWIPRSPNFNAHTLKKCQWKAIRSLPMVHSIHIKQSVHAKRNRYSADGDTSTSINHCGHIREHQGNMTLRNERKTSVRRVRSANRIHMRWSLSLPLFPFQVCGDARKFVTASSASRFHHHLYPVFPSQPCSPSSPPALLT